MTGTLTPFKDPKYLPLEKALEQLKAYVPPVIEHDAARLANKGFDIQEFDDYFRISGALYNDSKRTAFDWKKQLLDDGRINTLEEWLKQETGPGWVVPSAEIYTSTIIALYENRLHSDPDMRRKVLDMRQMLHSDFTRLMMTRTQIHYTADGKAIIDNNITFDDQKEMTAIISKELERKGTDILWADSLLGTSDVEKIIESYKWLTRNYAIAKDVQIRLQCSMAGAEMTCPVAMGFIGQPDEDWAKFLISADYPHTAQFPARGVRARLREDAEKDPGK
jgi:hypothetical protein